MLKLYYPPSPHPVEVALCLEEAGLASELVGIDTRKGEQHAPAFLTINPNAKTPALVDGDATVFVPEPKDHAVNRYTFEAERHGALVNHPLADKPWRLGDTYTLVDMAVWGWARMISRFLGPEGFATLPHVKRHLDTINARPAAQRAEALKDRFNFKQEMHAEARKVLFPQNSRLV